MSRRVHVQVQIPKSIRKKFIVPMLQEMNHPFEDSVESAWCEGRTLHIVGKPGVTREKIQSWTNSYFTIYAKL